MNSDEACKVAFISSLITALVMFTFLSVAHLSIMRDFEKGFQQDAVNNNIAEWVVDQKTGDTSFRWKSENSRTNPE